MKKRSKDEEKQLRARKRAIRKGVRRQNRLSFLRARITYPFLRLMVKLNRIKLPGFSGAGIYDVGTFFIAALGDRKFSLRAGAMAFRFFFALFPAIIFLFALLPIIPIDGLEDKVLLQLGDILPAEALTLIKETIGEVFSKNRYGTISFNLFLTIFTSLSGIRAMMFAFSKSDEEIYKKRNILQLNMVALLIFFVLSLVILGSVITLVTGELTVQWLIDLSVVGQGNTVTLLRLLEILIVFISLFFGVSVIYYLAPETRERWGFFNPGTFLTSILLSLAIYAFKAFFVNFANYNRFYGSMSAIMLLMVWFYWMSIVLLIGFELNAAIAKVRVSGDPLPARKTREELAMEEERRRMELE